MSPSLPTMCLVLLLSSLTAAGQQLPVAPTDAASSGEGLGEQSGDRQESQPGGESGQAQEEVKEARAALELAAIGLEQATPADMAGAIEDARASLDQFDQGLEQIRQSLSGQISLGLAESLALQVVDARALLASDPYRAAAALRALSLRITDLTAEADLLIGRPLLGRDGKWVGDVFNVLITSDGRIRALVIEQGGAPGSGERQVALEWSLIRVSGPQLTVDLTAEEVSKLPGYLVE